MGLSQSEELSGVKLGHDDELASLVECGVHHDNLPVNVIEGQNSHDTVRPAKVQAVLVDCLLKVGNDIVVSQHHALRKPTTCKKIMQNCP